MTILTVVEDGRPLSFSFEDLLKYHGPKFPGGVAHAFKVMERALPLLDENGVVERREIHISTAFPGPGARDAFEMVTRCVSDDRYAVNKDLPAAADVLESANGHYYFQLAYRRKTVSLIIRAGHVREEFVMLGRKADRTASEDRRLTELKQEMSDRLMKSPAAEVYDAVVQDEAY